MLRSDGNRFAVPFLLRACVGKNQQLHLKKNIITRHAITLSHHPIGKSRRNLTSVPSHGMSGMVMSSFGDSSVLRYVKDLPMPQLRSGDVLVQVHASSINPIDCLIRRGYARELLSTQRSHVPYIIPGFDCSGISSPLSMTHT